MLRFFNNSSKYLFCFVKQSGMFYRLTTEDLSVSLGVSDKTVL